MFDVSTGENIDLLCMPPSRRAVLATTGFTFQYYTFLENGADFIGVNSEIIPTRCNNCVYSSQWLYSTCFG